MAGVELTDICQVFLDEDGSLQGINLDTQIADRTHCFADYETKQIYNIIYCFLDLFVPNLWPFEASCII